MRRLSQFGLVSKLKMAFLGPVMLYTGKREQRQLDAGKTYEPPTFIERRNWTAQPIHQPVPSVKAADKSELVALR